MIAYSRTRYALYFISTAYALFANWLLLETGASAFYRDLALRLSRSLILQTSIVLALVTISTVLIMVPLTYYGGFWLEHHYHLSSQSLFDWLADTAKHIALNYGVQLLTLAIFFFLVKNFPTKWPFFLAGINTPIIIFMLFIAPVVFDPIFNKFTPMQDCSLKERIVKMLARAGVKDAPVYVADKSKQTNKLNAYVTGIGGTARVVIWDNLLKKMPDNQIMAVVGHELGHYRLYHIYIGLALALLFNFLTIPINLYLAAPFAAALPDKWHIKGLSDLAIIPAISMVAIFFSFLAAPATNAFSRLIEHQADEYALAIYGDRESMANAFVTLSEQNLSEPDPPKFIEFWLFSHPPLLKRIQFALKGSASFPHLQSQPEASTQP
jgi:Zn-dependent protease with chaperone function